jgi:hypothetical protein
MKVTCVRYILLIACAAEALTACAGRIASPEDQARAAFDDVKASIQFVVTDPDRATRATALVDEMDYGIKEAVLLIKERKADFRTLSASYDTPEAELAAALEVVRETMRENQRKLSDANRQLNTVLTASEWQSLQKALNSALEKAIAAASA